MTAPADIGVSLRDVGHGITMATIEYKPIHSVNLYLVPDDDGWALIDSGPAPAGYLHVVTDVVRSVDPRGLEAVRTVYLTHSHTDHIGQARQVQLRSGARCLLHPRAATFFAERYVAAYDEVLMGWLTEHGLPEEMRADITQTLPLQPPTPEWDPYGERLPLDGGAWEVIETEGHAPGHVSFVDRERHLLFCGDAVMETGVPLVDIQPTRSQRTMHDYLEGLERLRGLEIDLVLPGHGAPFPTLEQRIDELQAHHKRRIGQVLDGCRGQWQTAYDLSRGIWTTTRRLKTRLTLMATIGYLGYLQLEGEVEARTVDGVTQWRATGT